MEFQQYNKAGINFTKVIVGDFIATLCDLGASIYGVELDGKHMTQTLVHEEDFHNKVLYYGKTVGRSGNRIPGDSITIDGNTYKLEFNEGKNTLHGGKNGLSYQVFDCKVEQKENQIKVIYEYLSKHLESGFPGNLKIKITYTFNENESAIRCDYEAITDKPTICNLTNHSFFTMGVKNFEGCELKVNASNYLLCKDEDLLPIGREKVFKELDFRNFKNLLEDIDNPLINKGMAKGYDHNLYLDEVNPNIIQATYRSKYYQMDIYTDYECLQIYSDNYDELVDCYELDKGTRKSLTIETQDDFANRKILRPGETYKHFFKYVFSKR